MAVKTLVSSESVTEGHPDKICDQISDSILDACLVQDKNSRVAIETAVKSNSVYIFGELTTKASINIENIARKVLKRIGYTHASYGIDYKTAKIIINITKQSKNISDAVERSKTQLGAGDQGVVVGYATNETKEMIPLPALLAHKLAKQLSIARKSGRLPYLRPDGKTFVIAEYENNNPARIDTIIVSAQHSPQVSLSRLRKDITHEVVYPICKPWIDAKTKILINKAGKFIIGGPAADSGLTGRKIIVDAYGVSACHGGGAFSGKDATKVDRTGSYLARNIAKNLIRNKIASRVQVMLSYAIGNPEPISINVNHFGTSAYKTDEIINIIKQNFPLQLSKTIKYFNLQSPIFEKTASYGHFGRTEKTFYWENTYVKIKKPNAKNKSINRG